MSCMFSAQEQLVSHTVQASLPGGVEGAVTVCCF